MGKIDPADILLDHGMPKNRRARAWWRLMDDCEAMFPHLDAAMSSGLDIPVELYDHYLARMWIVTEGKSGADDLIWSSAFCFEDPWVGRAKPTAEELIRMSVRGKRFEQGKFHAVMRQYDAPLLLTMIQQGVGVPARFGLRQLLFYICSCWPESAALEGVRRIAAKAPAVVRHGEDANGRNALWYTLYRQHCFDIWFGNAVSKPQVEEVVSATDPLPTLLRTLGCDPNRSRRTWICRGRTSWSVIMDGRHLAELRLSAADF